MSTATWKATRFREGAVEPPAKIRQPDLWRGALAGLLGGMAGAAAQMLVEQIFPPRKRGQDAPPALLAEKVSGHHLTPSQRKLVKRTVHWSFGPLIGAAYGAAVEFEPELAARHGAAFGLGLNGLTMKGALPMLSPTEKPKGRPLQERWSEAASHIAFGVVTETVRKLIRGR